MSSATDALLQYQRLTDRLRTLTDEREHLVGRLGSSAEVDQAIALVEQAREERDVQARALRQADMDNADRRAKMRAHEKELMSGRIRSPHDLTRMSEEVAHMKAALAAAEEDQFAIMESVEELEAALKGAVENLDAVRARGAEAAPSLQARVNAIEAETSELELNRSGLWEQVPPPLQSQYKRAARLANPIVAVVGGQCGGCNVQLTANELQQLRRGERNFCQTCSRILVV